MEQCLNQLKKKKIAHFRVGQHDLSGRFLIRQKLYGRDQEIVELLDTFEHVCEGHLSTRFMLVDGSSGIGKTSLINEVHKPLTREGGRYISGKHDQYKRNIPYSAFIQAFRGLVCQLLTESDEGIAWWKAKLLEVLKENAQVVVEVIPEVEMIIGPQAPVPVLGPIENQNRFSRVFLNFTKVFARKKSPLVVFLDDLQWADLATLNLIQTIIADDCSYLLLIGAYRDNEVDDSHPLTRAVDALQNKSKHSIKRLTLRPLDLTDIKDLIADSLYCSREKADPLAQLVYGKTHGNPFFVVMFLKMLHHEKFITFAFHGGEWIWDLAEIEAMNITDNVVELMVERIQKFPGRTQHIISLAASIGNRFDVKTLALICEAGIVETFQTFWGVIQQGLVVPNEGGYKWVEHTDDKQQNPTFRFLHDRVQQAAYSLIPESERPALHLKIGRLLVGTLNTADEENVFEVVTHLNYGACLIHDRDEKTHLAMLNLAAARKAKLSSAYASALTLITAGIMHLPDDSWDTQYERTLSFYLEKGEIEYLNARWDESIATFDDALARVSTLLDRSRIRQYKTILYRMKNDLQSALDISIVALGELGFTLDTFPDDAAVAKEIERTRQLFSECDFDRLLALPELPDPLLGVTMSLLTECFAPAYFLGSKLTSIIGIIMTEITIKHGNCSYSPAGYIFYSSITLAVDSRDFDSAFLFGRLALQLNEKYHDKASEACILDMWGTFVCHHKEPIGIAKGHLLKGYYSGIENGSYQWAGYCAMIQLFMYFWGPNTLQEVSKNIELIAPNLEKIDPNMVQYFYAVQAAVFNLTHDVEHKTVLSDEIWAQQKAVLKRGFQQQDVFTLLVDATCRLSLANWYGDDDEAKNYAELGDTYLDGTPGVFINPVFLFHQSLAYASSYEKVDTPTQKHYLKKLESHLIKLEHWADHSPSTYLHQALLVKAEFARIIGNTLEAMELYDQAIDSALANEFLQNEALASELAAKFYLSRHQPRIASFYFQNAHYAYQRWGATGRVRHLEERYPDMLNSEVSPILHEVNRRDLDLSTVTKACQAISSEINLDKLLPKLMQIVIENTGAQRGLLILDRNGQLRIEVEGSGTMRRLSVEVTQHHNLPVSVVNYVARARESVVLHDAGREGAFINDPYIMATKPKSVLCFPILYRGGVFGLLYLENNATTGAFTEDRLAVLELLSAQIAISIDNATHYTELEQAVAERTKELHCAKAQAEAALEENLHRFREVLDTAHDAIISVDEAQRVLNFNQGASQVFGYTPEEVLGLPLGMLLPEAKQAAHTQQVETFADSPDTAREMGARSEIQGQRKTGEIFPAEATISKVLVGGEWIYTAVLRDITDRKQIEAQLQQTQKMEAVGHLAGGIAHDFNNILTSIFGYSELIKVEVQEHSEIRSHIEQVVFAAGRAKALVKRILTFSRQSDSSPQPIKIGPVINEVLALLRVSLPSTIEIRPTIEPSCGVVLADSTEIHQVIMNLCTNAAHAMQGQPGVLELSLRNVTPDVSNATDPKLSEKPYVELRIGDSGYGMPPEVMDHIFEPFFTTKERGEGTGLGLSVTHGIVVQCGGSITVESEVGHGTTFVIRIPQVDAKQEDLVDPPDHVIFLGTECILFVDDEPMLVELGRTMLERYGYTVVGRTSSTEPLELFRNNPDRFDVVVTDQIMAHMTGTVLAEEILQIRPEMPIILCSGYSEALSPAAIAEIGICQFVLKPLILTDLTRVIRNILN